MPGYVRRNAPAAQVAVVFLTSACDLDCPYCGSDGTIGVFSRREARSLVERLASDGFESVVFGGGEPLRWPHGLRELCAAARSRGLLTQVGTSAAALPPDAAEWREVDRWVLPLESAQAAAHDALRPMAGSHHAKVLAALHAFALGGRSVTVSSVARLGGDEDLAGVGQLLERLRGAGLRLHAWHLYRFQAMGRHGADNAERFRLTDEAWSAAAQGLKRRFPGLPLLLRPDMLHSKQVAFFWNTPQGAWRRGPLDWEGPVGLEASGPALH